MVIKSEGRDASDFFFVSTRGVIEALYIGRIAFLSYGDDRKWVDEGSTIWRDIIFFCLYIWEFHIFCLILQLLMLKTAKTHILWLRRRQDIVMPSSKSSAR